MEDFNGTYNCGRLLEESYKSFLLVNMVAKRVRQIREGSEYLVNSPKNEDIVIALREVAASKIEIKKVEPKAIAETESKAIEETESKAIAEAESEIIAEEESEVIADVESETTEEG